VFNSIGDNGGHLKNKNVRYHRAKNIKIYDFNQAYINVDGENLIFYKEMNIEVIPGLLDVIY